MEEMKVIRGNNCIHLFSGGLDSTYCLFKLCKELEERSEASNVQPIFVDYGQFASIAEWSSVRRVIEFIRSELLNHFVLKDPIILNFRSDLFIWTKSVAFTGIETRDSTPEIENRNMVLLSILYSYAIACARNQGVPEAEFDVYSGFKDGEIGDCNTLFLNALSELMKQYHQEYTMKFNLLPANLTRGKTYDKLRQLVKGSQPKLKTLLDLTISCYSPINGKACHNCWKCRKIAEEKLQ